MKNLTTLGKVFDRVDAMNQHCYDNLVDVSDISFDSLDAVKMGSDLHPLLECNSILHDNLTAIEPIVLLYKYQYGSFRVIQQSLQIVRALQFV